MLFYFKAKIDKYDKTSNNFNGLFAKRQKLSEQWEANRGEQLLD